MPRPRITARQREYLIFIGKYLDVHSVAPAEADIQKAFMVSAPSVHQMLVTLERRGLISRVPGEARSIRLLVSPAELAAAAAAPATPGEPPDRQPDGGGAVTMAKPTAGRSGRPGGQRGNDMSEAQALSKCLEMIRRLAAEPPTPGRAGAMADLAMRLRFAWRTPYGEVALAPAREVMVTIRAVWAAAGAGRARTERYLTDLLESILLTAVMGQRQSAAGCALARELWAFGQESLAFRRPRDTTAGQRHEQVYALLATAARWVPAPEVLALARRALCTETEVAIAGGLRLLDECVPRRGGDPGQALVRELQAVQRRTRDRNNLVGVLDLLIRLGAESEWGALTAVENWDEREARRLRREQVLDRRRC